MRRKIPSNTALMAFEAAARHGSFARAADELSLTEGAISRQIGRLEAFLGVTLFERIGNRVRLLPHGERYAIQVRELLDQLDRDSQYLMGQPADGASLDIAVLPTFAMRWLIPRLPRFRQQHPRISVHLAERADPFALVGERVRRRLALRASGLDRHADLPAVERGSGAGLSSRAVGQGRRRRCAGRAATLAPTPEPGRLAAVRGGNRNLTEQSRDGGTLRSACHAHRGRAGWPRGGPGAALLCRNRTGARAIGCPVARGQHRLQDLLPGPARTCRAEQEPLRLFTQWMQDEARQT